MTPQTEPAAHDCFELLYALGEPGWSELHILCGREWLGVPIVRVAADPIADLIALCHALLRGEDSYQLRLHDEPGSTVIRVATLPGQRHVARFEIWLCNNDRDEPPAGTMLLSFDASVRRFVGLLRLQFEKVRWLLEEGNELAAFPHSDFATLTEAWRAYGV